MKVSNKIVGAIAMAACTPVAIAQSGPDYKPANPNNWQIIWTHQGSDSYQTWFLQSGVPAMASGSCAWPGVFSPLPSTAALGPGLGYYQSEGQRLLNVEWIGLGAAPGSVLMTITAQAEAAAVGGSVNLTSDFAGQTLDLSSESGWPVHRRVYGSSRLALPIVQGEDELMIEQYARADCNGPSGYLPFLPSCSVGAEPVERSVGLDLPWTTYYRDPQNAERYPNLRSQWDGMVGDSIIRDYRVWPWQEPWGRASVPLSASLSGPWQTPVAVWWGDGNEEWGGTLSETLVREVSSNELVAMIATATPLVVPVSVRVVETCANPIERTNHYTLRLHAEREYVSADDPIIQYESWRRVSPVVYGPARLGRDQSTSVTDSFTFTQSFATTTTLGLKDLLAMAVADVTGVQYGRSVTIATGFSSSYDVPSGCAGWIVQRPFAAIRLVKLSKWTETGYDGYEYAGEYYALSGPERAPSLDFEEGLHVEPLP